MTAVILEPKRVKSDTAPIVSPSICHEVMGLDTMILVFLMFSFKPAFSLYSFTFIKKYWAFIYLLTDIVRESLQVIVWFSGRSSFCLILILIVVITKHGFNSYSYLIYSQLYGLCIFYLLLPWCFTSLLVGSDGKKSVGNAWDLGLIPELWRSPGEGNSYPLQYFQLPLLWPGEFHGLYGPWGRKESDMTERVSLTDVFFTV